MKIFFRRIHLWLSLAAGLVIWVACLTGALLVFEEDLEMALNKSRYYVQPTGNLQHVDSLASMVLETYPGNKLQSVKTYADSTRSWEFVLSAPGKAQQRGGGFLVFVDPFTGQVLEKYSYREGFFFKVMALHRWLLGSPGSVGKYIVGISTLIFLFILITGIILWWPRTARIMKQRINIKWSAGWKRINHDLHLVLGFYSSILLFIISFTGLAWSFEWFNNGIYAVTGSSRKPAPVPHSIDSTAPRASWQSVLSKSIKISPDVKQRTIKAPKSPSEVFTVQCLPVNAVHSGASDAYYFDQSTVALLGKLDYRDRNLGARTRSMFKPIHTGSIWGWPSKILAFLACVVGLILPITGVVMWINRKK